MINEMANEDAVQATNDDASECKRCAVQLGYWTDPFIPLFVKQNNRKAPEINRGYFARVKGIEVFIDKFLKASRNEDFRQIIKRLTAIETLQIYPYNLQRGQTQNAADAMQWIYPTCAILPTLTQTITTAAAAMSGGQSQIINLGSGFDTLYWRLRDAGNSPQNLIEMDFPSVTARKCYHIKRHKQLLDRLNTEDGEISFSATDLHAANYHLIGIDLRNTSELESKLGQAEVNFKLPTLFIAECVLVYVDGNAISNLLQWFAKKFPNSLFVNYEQVNMRDKFGEIMLSNLRTRGCLLAGVEDCESLETQQRRFTLNGWEGSNAWTMVEIYDSLPSSERTRIEHIEMLDERELLTQLLQHYCISVAWNGQTFRNISIAQG